MANKRARFIPAKKPKDKIRRIYAKLARVYDLSGTAIEWKAAGRALEMAAIKDGESVLEVAVGTGRVFEKIVLANHGGRSVGIDMSPEMLARAEQRLKQQSSDYSLSIADAYSLPFPDETFDVIINNYMFDLLPEEDFRRVLLEFRRVLKTGGRVAITTMTPGNRWYHRGWDWLARVTNIFVGCRPVSLVEDIGQAGFGDIHAEYASQLTFPCLVVRARKP